MLNAQTLATYSFGLTFETSYISEQFRITANACLYFPQKSYQHLLRGFVPILDCKDTNKQGQNKIKKETFCLYTRILLFSIILIRIPQNVFIQKGCKRLRMLFILHSPSPHPTLVTYSENSWETE